MFTITKFIYHKKISYIILLQDHSLQEVKDFLHNKTTHYKIKILMTYFSVSIYKINSRSHVKYCCSLLTNDTYLQTSTPTTTVRSG